MNITHIVMFKFLTGASEVTVTAPTAPGLEFTSVATPMHYSTQGEPLHFTSNE